MFPSVGQHRRPFQFGLRTMFLVVTLVAILLGWLLSERRFIAERREARVAARASRNQYVILSVAYVRGINWPGGAAPVELDAPTIPFWRRWLGDKPVAVLYINSHSEEDWAALRRLFPEAQDLSTFPPLLKYELVAEWGSTPPSAFD